MKELLKFQIWIVMLAMFLMVSLSQEEKTALWTYVEVDGALMRKWQWDCFATFGMQLFEVLENTVGFLQDDLFK